MAVKHIFRSVGGELKTANLTPIKAIREHCVECVQSRRSDILENCGGEKCALFPFRLGTAHRRQGGEIKPPKPML